ncbi:MAG: metallophosphoesterase [bacterium]|nr:metallophosphoesterase [bacterium]
MDSASFQFGIICDCQYTDADSDTSAGGVRQLSYGTQGKSVTVPRDRQYRLSLDKLNRAIDKFNSEKVDFIFHLGDLADNSLQDYQPVNKRLDEAAMPVYQVIGNRDYLACGHDPKTVCRQLGLDEPYYSLTYHNTRFIVLDSNELGVINTKPGTKQRRQAQDYIETLRRQEVIYAHLSNGGLGQNQYDWLKNQLDSATAAHQSIIVLSHHPLYPLDIHNMLNTDKILELLAGYKITAFLNGHNHAGNYGLKNQTPYITFPGLVEGTSEAHSIARIDGNSVNITGYGRHANYSFELKTN